MTESPETTTKKSYEVYAFWLCGTFSGTDLKYQDFCISRTWRSDLSLFNFRLCREKNVESTNKQQNNTYSWKYEILEKY